MNARLRAEAAAATVWGLQESLNRRVFGCDHSDVAVVGKARPPFSSLVDRYHPARGQPGVPPLLTNGRAFAQATWRHALFGSVLGRLA